MLAFLQSGIQDEVTETGTNQSRPECLVTITQQQVQQCHDHYQE